MARRPLSSTTAVLVGAGIAVTAACSSDSSEGGRPVSAVVADEQNSLPVTSMPSGDPPERPNVGDAEAGQAEIRDDAYLFDSAKLHTFEFSLAEEDLAVLDADPTAEKYVPAAMTFENETLEVGLRYKGSVGAFVGCLDGPDPLRNPSGKKTCTKLSLKVKINWDDPGDEFLGVRKIQLHAMNNDPSQMRERVGYHLMREMGVAAPRATHARVVVNGEYIGLFALVENIDGRFVRANFDDGSGNLYKEVWPFAFTGSLNSRGSYVPGEEAVTDEEKFLSSLRTNEDDAGDASLIREFANELLNSENPAAVVREFMDVELLMNQLAVDRTIRHDDGPFHWYCELVVEDLCGNHNFFFYEDPSRSKITMIPWDFDNAFANIVRDDNPVTPVADGLGEITDDCAIFAYGAFQLPQRSASCDPLFAVWASMEAEYLAAVERLHAGPLSESELDPSIEMWVEQISAATAEAADAHGDAVNITRWNRALDDFSEALDFARNNPIGA